MAFWTLAALVAVMYALALVSLRRFPRRPRVRRAEPGLQRVAAGGPPLPQAPRSLYLGPLYLFGDQRAQAEGSEPMV